MAQHYGAGGMKTSSALRRVLSACCCSSLIKKKKKKIHIMLSKHPATAASLLASVIKYFLLLWWQLPAVVSCFLPNWRLSGFGSDGEILAVQLHLPEALLVIWDLCVGRPLMDGSIGAIIIGTTLPGEASAWHWCVYKATWYQLNVTGCSTFKQ